MDSAQELLCGSRVPRWAQGEAAEGPQQLLGTSLPGTFTLTPPACQE